MHIRVLDHFGSECRWEQTFIAHTDNFRHNPSGLYTLCMCVNLSLSLSKIKMSMYKYITHMKMYELISVDICVDTEHYYTLNRLRSIV